MLMLPFHDDDICTNVPVAVLICKKLQRVLLTVFKVMVAFHISDAFDTNLMYKTMQDIAANKTVEIPTYDYVTHKRLAELPMVYVVQVITVMVQFCWDIVKVYMWCFSGPV